MAGAAIIEIKDVLRRLQDDKQLLIELVTIFLDGAPEGFEKVQQLIDQGDFSALSDAAHSLKGAAANIGAQKLAKSFLKIEEAAKQKEIRGAHEAFENASNELNELKEYFPKLIAQLSY